ncbi:MAG: matrixin family metalloprotease [Acidimicrobiales bacterium]
MDVRVALVPSRLAVGGDGRAGCDVRVRNDGTEPVRLRLEVGGDAAPWARCNPSALTLAPGAEGAARLGFNVPRQAPSGSHSFVVRAGPGREQPGGAAEGVVEVPTAWPLAATAAPTGTAPAPLDEPTPVGEGPHRQPSTRSRRPATLVVAGSALVVGLAVAAGLVWATVRSSDDAEEPARPFGGCVAEGHLARVANGGRRPVDPPPPNYSFLSARADGCSPVRFNPCQPIHYVLNDALASERDVADVREAFIRLAEATGMTFVSDGSTDEPALVSRPAYQPERYGRRWAPILIGWARLGPARGDLVVAGMGRPLVVDDIIVSGVLQLNLDAISHRETEATLPNGFGASITWGRVMLHELGHVLGLGHVGNKAQLMHDELTEHTSPTAEFGSGDLTGLSLVGREAGCLTPPPLPF